MKDFIFIENNLSAETLPHPGLPANPVCLQTVYSPCTGIQILSLYQKDSFLRLSCPTLLA
jgi:hypothetical protein